MIASMFLAGSAFISANFIYAALFSHTWAAAFERSYFQGILLLWLITTVALHAKLSR